MEAWVDITNTKIQIRVVADSKKEEIIRHKMIILQSSSDDHYHRYIFWQPHSFCYRQ